MVVFSLGTLVGLIIGTGEGSLVGLSLVLTLGYPLGYPNPGAYLTGTLLGMPLGCGLALKRSGVYVADDASWIVTKLLDGG